MGPTIFCESQMRGLIITQTTYSRYYRKNDIIRILSDFLHRHHRRYNSWSSPLTCEQIYLPHLRTCQKKGTMSIPATAHKSIKRTAETVNRELLNRMR